MSGCQPSEFLDCGWGCTLRQRREHPIAPPSHLFSRADEVRGFSVTVLLRREVGQQPVVQRTHLMFRQSRSNLAIVAGCKLCDDRLSKVGVLLSSPA